MKLKRFRVHKFKSIVNSGWITCDALTTFIGENEAGKTSMITALWKLNPSSGGELDLLHDLPRAYYQELKNMEKHHVFVEAEYVLDDDLIEKILATEQLEADDIRLVRVLRDFDGNYYVKFPSLMSDSDDEMSDDVNVAIKGDINNKSLKDFILQSIPKFIFYSNYGNLDTEIYLPQIVESFNRSNMSEHASQKRKTLEVLFEYIGIDPAEILALAQDEDHGIVSNISNLFKSKKQLMEDFKNIADRKTEYKIMLNAASSRLTKEFNSWWKQNKYDFDLQFDGKYLKIWVTDQRRGMKMELESRSTGLQWFLSFFLIFTVEQRYSKTNSILLLDEAGISLHPSAQADLYNFIMDLAATNQIINNTHSPYLSDISYAHMLKIVYVDHNGNTTVNQDFRVNFERTNERSMTTLKSALQINVAEPILNGATTVIVPSKADQNYFIGIKNYLIANRRINPIEELIFVSLSQKSIWPIASMMQSINGKLPTVLLDGLEDPTKVIEELRGGLYKDKKDLIVTFQDLVPGVKSPSAEDFVTYPVLRFGIGRLYKDLTENVFEAFFKPETQLVRQIKDFADLKGLWFTADWRTQLSATTKKLLQNQLIAKPTVDENTINAWTQLFTTLIENK